MQCLAIESGFLDIYFVLLLCCSLSLSSHTWRVRFTPQENEQRHTRARLIGRGIAYGVVSKVKLIYGRIESAHRKCIELCCFLCCVLTPTQRFDFDWNCCFAAVFSLRSALRSCSLVEMGTSQKLNKQDKHCVSNRNCVSKDLMLLFYYTSLCSCCFFTPFTFDFITKWLSLDRTLRCDDDNEGIRDELVRCVA